MGMGISPDIDFSGTTYAGSQPVPIFSQPANHLPLENVRRLVERNRQDPGVDLAVARPMSIGSVGIIGAGMMGAAIAAAHIQYGLPVVICDANEVVLAGARSAIEASLQEGRLVEEPRKARAKELVGRLVQARAELAVVSRADLVLESIVETLSAKQGLYAQLQARLGAGTILASNTSTIPIARLAEGLVEPDRFCGMHFYHPVARRPLVEITRGPRTSDQTVATAVAHVKAIGRMPIVVEDGPGLVVNRLLFPYLTEALELLREGARIEEIEQAATDFGMALGPLRLIDEIGLDTTLHAGWVLSAAFPERIVASPLLVTLVKAGRLGRKAGAGFFAYDHAAQAGASGVPSPHVKSMIARWAVAHRSHTPKSIADRLLLPMVLEATCLLEEGKVRDVRDLDLGAVFGLGFPPTRGGLLWWADTLGAAEVVSRLRSLDGNHCRHRPTAMLEHLAHSGGRFHHDPADQGTFQPPLQRL